MAERFDARYDAVVVGGAFSGSVLASLLRRLVPTARVLIVEAGEAFDHKVGEATVEISAFMLSRVLGLHDLMAREHLPKHGLRYWFADRPERSLPEMSEVGPREVPRLPAFQLDRSRLDESLLTRARELGVEVLRPAKVVAHELGWPESQVTIEQGGARRTVATRWLIDASGRQAMLARRLGLLKRTTEHPTAAAWARFRGVADLDGPEVNGSDPRSPRLPPVSASRRLATNHFLGRGWWCWMIPLAGGETSIGVVYDRRLFELPGSGSLEERFLAFLQAQPGLRELVAGAEPVAGDFRSYAHLAYLSERYMDRGWALVGDAAAFLDPYYSPGLDHASISCYATARLLEEDLLGKLDEAGLQAAIADHNSRFQRSYRRWLGGLYQDKYEIFGDAELTAASFLMDTAMYYIGVVTPIHEDLENLQHPLFGQAIAQTRWAFRFMRFYNQRLVKLARIRQAVGLYGRRNRGWRLLVQTASLGRSGGLPMLRQGIRVWLGAELATFGWRLRRGRWFLSLPKPAQAHAEPAS